MPDRQLHNEKYLLQRVSQGDTAAFSEFFQHYYGTLYTVTLQYTKFHEVAEDIVQQVFLKLWEKRHTLTAVEKPGSFLVIMARNEIIDWLRKASNHTKYLQTMRELFDTGINNPEEELITKQKRAIIQEAVSNLPPQQQQAYRLSRDKGMSYDEVAQNMNLSVSTVKGHISAALRSVRQHLQTHRNDLYLALITCGLYNY